MSGSVDWGAWLRLTPPAAAPLPKAQDKIGRNRQRRGERDARVMAATDQEKDFFWAHVRLPEPNGCLLYESSRKRGYAQSNFQGVRVNVQRVAKLWQEPPPVWGAYPVRHLCASRLCVNSDHLYWAVKKK